MTQTTETTGSSQTRSFEIYGKTITMTAMRSRFGTKWMISNVKFPVNTQMRTAAYNTPEEAAAAYKTYRDRIKNSQKI